MRRWIFPLALLLAGCIETEQANVAMDAPTINPFMAAAQDSVIYAPGTLPCLGYLMNEGFLILPLGAEVERWTYTPPTTGTPGVTSVYQLEWEAPADRVMSHVVISPAIEGTMRLRVAERDSLDRLGVWSDWGEK